MPSARLRDHASELDALRGLRVLVVDDDPDLAEATVVMLEVFGATAVPATSVERARVFLSLDDFDIVVSDLTMPVEGGIALVRWLRTRDAPLASLPALAMSGSVVDSDAEDAIAAGFDAYLRKAPDPAALAETVRDLVERRRRNFPRIAADK